MTAHEQFEHQVALDRKHHQDRIDWLTGPNPCYSDGIPVAKIDAVNWLHVSRACLADVSGMTGFNSHHE